MGILTMNRDFLLLPTNQKRQDLITDDDRQGYERPPIERKKKHKII